MSLVTLHTLRHLFASLAFLVTVLATGVWLTQSLRFLEVIVNQNISIGDYFSLVSFLIPDLVSTILPLCVLISVLFTYNKSISSHEMGIFRACGLSNWRLARPALVMAFFIACCATFINVYLVPLSFRNFRDMEYRFRNEFSTGFIQDGTFNTLRGVTVYARHRAGNGDLEGVFIHSMGQRPTASAPKRNGFTIVAQQGTLVEKAGKKPLLMLFNGTRQEKDEKTGKINFFHFQALSYDLDQLAVSVQERLIKPYERSLSDLLDPGEGDNLPWATKAHLRAEAHQRLLSPLLVIVFALIGLCALLPQELNRRGRQKRIMGAVAFAAGAHMALIFLININGKWGGAIPLAYFFILVLALVCLFVLEKQAVRALVQSLRSGVRYPAGPKLMAMDKPEGFCP